MFPHHTIHKYTWTSKGKMHHQTDHVLKDKRQHSSVLDVQYFRGADAIWTIVWSMQKSETVNK